jgi:hypothetical protein
MPGLLRKAFKGTTDYLRLVSFFSDHADPWERLQMQVSARTFGLASESEFWTYLDGPSRVPARSVEEVCAWLRDCEAIDDQTLFLQPDFWQHPAAFEQLRRGDCEDHALWAWRQLHRLGLQTFFMAGLWRNIPHTWVTYHRAGTEYLIETTAKSGEMTRPLDGARAFYCPALAVDNQCRTYVYQGYQRFKVGMARSHGV